MFDYLVWLLRRILVLTQAYLKCKICFFWLRQLRRVRRSINIESVKTLVHAFVTSRVDYCNSVLSFAPKKATTSCGTFKMLQHVWSLGPGNMSVVCLGWRTMTCTGWIFLSDCSTSLLWQSIVVFGTELQGILNAGYCVHASLWSFWSPAPAICQMSSTLPRVRRSTSGTRTLFVAAPRVWNSLHDYQLLTPNNLGETWRRVSFAGSIVEALAH